MDGDQENVGDLATQDNLSQTTPVTKYSTSHECSQKFSSASDDLHQIVNAQKAEWW